MKLGRIFLPIITLLAICSCSLFEDPHPDYGPYVPESWTCTVNTDGTDFRFLVEEHKRSQFFPNDSEILVGNKYIIDSNGAIKMNFPLLDTLTIQSMPSIHPNGNKFLFSAKGKKNFSDYDIYLMNIETLQLVNLTNTPNICEYYPRFSQDGNKIVFTTIQDSLRTISIMDIKGDNITQVIKSETKYYRHMMFSPDCDKIFFLLRNLGIYSVNIDGSNEIALCQKSLSSDFPFSMPENGSKIVFGSEDHIFVMNEDGTDIKDLGEGTNPTISHDGSKIVSDNIYVMNIDGTEKTRITENGTCPNFSHGDDKIIFLYRYDYWEK